jgi:hypothetical protein
LNDRYRLLYISELMGTQSAPAGAFAARSGIASKIGGGEAIERSRYPEGPYSTSFARDIQPTGPGIQ